MLGLTSGQLGLPTLYFLVGYVTVTVGFLLALSARTSTYSGILKAVLSAPLPAAVLAAPLVFVVGIAIHLLRTGVLRHLFHQSAYRLSVLTDSERADLRAAVSMVHPRGATSRDIGRPETFEVLQARLDPAFNPYNVHARWLYDLFADLVPIALFAIAVVASRAIAFRLEGLDWAILTLGVIVLLVAAFSIPSLRAEFTIHDVTQFVLQHQPERDAEDLSKGSSNIHGTA